MIDISPAKPVTEAERVIGLGAEITLLDGTRKLIRFGFAEIARLEDEYGSLSGVGDVFRRGGLGKLFNDILRILSIAWSMSRDEIAALLDSTKIQEYFEACDRAFTAALPPLKAGPSPNQKADGAPSTGPSSTTSPPSASTAPTPSSDT